MRNTSYKQIFLVRIFERNHCAPSTAENVSLPVIYLTISIIPDWMIVFFLSPFLFPSSNFFHLQWGLKRGDFCQLFCGHVAHKGHLSETILTTTDVPSFSGLQSTHPHSCGHIDRPKRGGSDGLFVCNILAKIEWAIFYSPSRRAELLLHCSTFFLRQRRERFYSAILLPYGCEPLCYFFAF